MLEVILFYKFVEIKNPEEFIQKQKEFCQKLGILGKLLIGNEGVNGSISGTIEQIEKYKQFLTSDLRFSDIRFKTEQTLSHPFTKMIIRERKEIVTLGKEVDTTKGADYITSDELNQLYNNNEDFIILDSRNDFESKLGKFKNAITPPIKTFKQFPEYLKSIEHLKDKKIITYCTGGIRCEKATALMIQEGFSNVYQLKDGIITFCQSHPNTHWEGKVFVFDKRLVSDPGNEKKTITNCECCGIKCDLLKNCRYNDCDKLIIECADCQEKFHGCCSKNCMKQFLKESRARKLILKN